MLTILDNMLRLVLRYNPWLTKQLILIFFYKLQALFSRRLQGSRQLLTFNRLYQSNRSEISSVRLKGAWLILRNVWVRYLKIIQLSCNCVLTESSLRVSCINVESTYNKYATVPQFGFPFDLSLHFKCMFMKSWAYIWNQFL